MHVGAHIIVSGDLALHTFTNSTTCKYYANEHAQGEHYCSFSNYYCKM